VFGINNFKNMIKSVNYFKELSTKDFTRELLSDDVFMEDLINNNPIEVVLAINTAIHTTNDHYLIYSKYNGGCNFEWSVEFDESLLSKEAQDNINGFIKDINGNNGTFNDNYFEVLPITGVEEVKLIEKRFNHEYDLFCFSEEYFVTDLFISNIDIFINYFKENSDSLNSYFIHNWDEIKELYEFFPFYDVNKG
jgi:hypothetical protein